MFEFWLMSACSLFVLATTLLFLFLFPLPLPPFPAALLNHLMLVFLLVVSVGGPSISYPNPQLEDLTDVLPHPLPSWLMVHADALYWDLLRQHPRLGPALSWWHPRLA